MGSTRIDSATDIVVEVTGPAGVSQAEDLTRTFTGVLVSPIPLVTMDLSGIDQVDVTFYQLILAFNNSLTKQNRHLMIYSLPDSHIVIVQAALLGIKLEHHVTMVGIKP
jgi:hypothetical protein